MFKYIGKRLLQFIVILFLVSIACFSINYISPIDVAKKALVDPTNKNMQDEQLIEKFKEENGLNEPLHIQYINWLKDVLKGDLGNSLITGRPVIEDITYHFDKTFKLSLLSMFLAICFAIPLGVICALYKGKVVDAIGRICALLAVSMPSFWLAYLLIIVFALKLNIFPVAGYGDGEIKNMLLPAIVTSVMSFGTIMKMTRNSMAEVMEQDYIINAEAKGLSKTMIIIKHALKNALIPIVTLSGMTFASLLAGTAVIEEIFAWPGIGHLILDGINNQDFPLVQGCVIFISIIYLFINLVVDLIYIIIDPRIRYENEK